MASLTSFLSELQTSFYFSVTIVPFSFMGAFAEVSGLSKSLELEEVKSGGENSFRYQLPKGVKYDNLVLKRGVSLSGILLSAWCAQTLHNDFASPIITADVLVSLNNADGIPTMNWMFAKAYPVKWEMSDLKAQENALLIEKIELAHQGCILI